MSLHSAYDLRGRLGPNKHFHFNEVKFQISFQVTILLYPDKKLGKLVITITLGHAAVTT